MQGTAIMYISGLSSPDNMSILVISEVSRLIMRAGILRGSERRVVQAGSGKNTSKLSMRFVVLQIVHDLTCMTTHFRSGLLHYQVSST